MKLLFFVGTNSGTGLAIQGVDTYPIKYYQIIGVLDVDGLFYLKSRDIFHNLCTSGQRWRMWSWNEDICGQRERVLNIWISCGWPLYSN